MSELDELLDLLDGAASRSWQTAHVTARHRTDPNWAREYIAELTRTPVDDISPMTERDLSTSWEAWIAHDKQREDLSKFGEETTIIWTGDAAHMRGQGKQPFTRGPDIFEGEVGIPWRQMSSRYVLNPSPMTEEFSFRVEGTEQVIGREVFVVRAESRRRRDLDPSYSAIHWWWDCESARLNVDVERGAVLVAEGYVGQRLVRSIVVRSITFDEQFDDSLFAWSERDTN
jgi:hypothetical protein